MPVVENLEDMWKVTKLQRQRKARQEAERALQELNELKNASKEAKVPSEVHSTHTSTLAYKLPSVRQFAHATTSRCIVAGLRAVSHRIVTDSHFELGACRIVRESRRAVGLWKTLLPWQAWSSIGEANGLERSSQATGLTA